MVLGSSPVANITGKEYICHHKKMIRKELRKTIYHIPSDISTSTISSFKGIERKHDDTEVKNVRKSFVNIFTTVPDENK